MVIKKILKQLTPEKVKKELKLIQRVKLPSELQKWVKEYEKVGERDEFLWKWMYEAVQINTASCVEKKYQKSEQEIKFLIIMFILLLDDVVDKTKNKKLLDELLKIPLEKIYIKFDKLKQNEKKYFKFARKVWNYIRKKIKKYPKYKEFIDIFEYDIAQTLNAMKYEYFINKNYPLINKTECWLYSPHTMQSLVSCTIDLMCSPEFDVRELGKLRKVAWLAQKMARIGNWVSTWKREIKEKDFTSGVFVYAIDSDILPLDDLKKKDEKDMIKKIKNSKIEDKLLEEWGEYYKEIKNLNKKIKSVNVQKILSGSEKFLILHLINR